MELGLLLGVRFSMRILREVTRLEASGSGLGMGVWPTRLSVFWSDITGSMVGLFEKELRRTGKNLVRGVLEAEWQIENCCNDQETLYLNCVRLARLHICIS